MMIGFAGDVVSFESDFHMYNQAQNCLEIIKIAVKFQNGKYEVIIADNKDEKIYTIKNSITQESKVGFIGDSDAFSEYQKAYHENTPIIIDPNHAQINPKISVIEIGGKLSNIFSGNSYQTNNWLKN